jgi:hypothetical protein
VPEFVARSRHSGIRAGRAGAAVLARPRLGGVEGKIAVK